jgi:hypothetical protein
MPFSGEERYREALARAEGHESMSAMVKVDDLKAALDEISRLIRIVEAAREIIVEHRAAIMDGNSRLDPETTEPIPGTMSADDAESN